MQGMWWKRGGEMKRLIIICVLCAAFIAGVLLGLSGREWRARADDNKIQEWATEEPAEPKYVVVWRYWVPEEQGSLRLPVDGWIIRTDPPLMQERHEAELLSDLSAVRAKLRDLSDSGHAYDVVGAWKLGPGNRLVLKHKEKQVKEKREVVEERTEHEWEITEP